MCYVWFSALLCLNEEETYYVIEKYRFNRSSSNPLRKLSRMGNLVTSKIPPAPVAVPTTSVETPASDCTPTCSPFLFPLFTLSLVMLPSAPPFLFLVILTLSCPIAYRNSTTIWLRTPSTSNNVSRTIVSAQRFMSPLETRSKTIMCGRCSFVLTQFRKQLSSLTSLNETPADSS